MNCNTLGKFKNAVESASEQNILTTGVGNVQVGIQDSITTGKLGKINRFKKKWNISFLFGQDWLNRYKNRKDI